MAMWKDYLVTEGVVEEKMDPKTALYTDGKKEKEDSAQNVQALTEEYWFAKDAEDSEDDDKDDSDEDEKEVDDKKSKKAMYNDACKK